MPDPPTAKRVFESTKQTSLRFALVAGGLCETQSEFWPIDSDTGNQTRKQDAPMKRLGMWSRFSMFPSVG
jgi:hypothetical protein